MSRRLGAERVVSPHSRPTCERTRPRRRPRRRGSRPWRASCPGSRPRRRTRSSSTRSTRPARPPPARARWPRSRDMVSSPPVSTIVRPGERLRRPRRRRALVGHAHAGRPQLLDQREVLVLVEPLADRRPRSRGRSPARRRSRPRSRRRQRVDRAERPREHLRDVRADVADVEPDQQPPDRPVLRRLHLLQHVRDRLVLEARAAGASLLGVERVDVGGVLDQPGLEQAHHGHVAEVLDVHRAAPREVEQPLDALRRAAALVRAAVVGLALGAHERRAARGARRRHLPASRALLPLGEDRARRSRGSRRRRGGRSPCRPCARPCGATSSSLCRVA